MKKCLIALILGAVCAHGAIAIIAHHTYALGASGGTTSSLDITGATNISIGVCMYTAAGTKPPTVTDSKGDTLNARTAQDSSEPYIRIYDYDFGSALGSTTNYTVTVTSSSSFSSVGIIAWAGGKASASFDLQAGGIQNSSGGTSVQDSASVTPSEANEILVSFLCYSASNTPTIDSSFTTPGANDRANYSAGANEGIIQSWQIQTTATARQPTWSWTSNQRGVTALATYKQAASGTDFPRSASDGSMSESVARSWGPVRGAADGTASVALARLVVYGRPGADGTLSEATTRSWGPHRGAADGSLSESMARLLASMRGPADGSLSESPTSLRNVPVGLSDGTLSVSASRLLASLRGPADGSLSESTGRSRGFVRFGADGSLTALVDRAGVFNRSAGDTGFVSVVVFDGHAFIINLSSTTFSSEGVSRYGTFSRSITGGSFSETLSRSGAFGRVLSDGSTNESLSRAPLLLARFAADGSIAESTTRHGAFLRTGADSSAVSFTLSTSGGSSSFPVIPLDHQAVYEGIGRVAVYRGFVRGGIYMKSVSIVVVTK